MYFFRKLLLGLLMLLSSSASYAATCLNGFELTAIVVFENAIKQSVESYACRMAFPEHESTYHLYGELRQTWMSQKLKQDEIRDAVYQRIYGDNWQDKIDEWEQLTAVRESKLFKPEINGCYDLRMEILEHTYSWKSLFTDAARKAAGEVYDSLRCVNVKVE